MPSSREFSLPKDRIQVSHIIGKFFTVWATSEALTYDSFPKIVFHFLCSLTQ